ncbi:putative 2-hydroxyacid dehydrogenase YoaD [Microbacterium oxydans]|uniref:Putative 2-hydroxyacid dehydrogenase YoaD n=1 Tax=Microbacterium oxydans TaxID=82380 RepID=A0A0F0L118_9MICO|nr:hydroxyacid dehydrogenase [Microbacterium oxydans]KJL26075.1 putative 2-hydroxyacid dehydrogenase YoaD [Microbacterium oxydans]
MTLPPSQMPTARPPAQFLMRRGLVTQLFAPEQFCILGDLLDFGERPVIQALDDPRLRTVHTLITGWGCPRIGPEELDRMPALRAIHHAAGTVKEHLDPEVWHRGIRVTTAAAANAVPVAEYTLAMILLEGKGIPRAAAAHREDPARDLSPLFESIGNHRRRIGILGASKIGRRVIGLLRGFDFDVAVSDPYLRDDDPIREHARVVDLDELFSNSDIVSVHAPLLPETVGLVSRRLLGLMPDGATLINTARGRIVDHDALVAEVRAERLRAVLDVTDPEPLPAGHVLLESPSVIVTPHIAGALGNELRRLGESVVAEVRRAARGETARHAVSLDELAAMA